jgi:hypothetical protein
MIGLRFLIEKEENPYKDPTIPGEYETFIDFGERSIPVHRGIV